MFVCKRCAKCCSDVELTLFEWEANELSRFKFAKVEPAICVDIGKLRLILYWRLLGKPCPFLQDKRCTIYPSRPLVCKAFPLLHSGASGGDGMIGGKCPNALSGTLSEIARHYGDTYTTVQKLDAARMWIGHLVKIAALNYAGESGEFGLLEFLAKKNVIDEEFIAKQLALIHTSSA